MAPGQNANKEDPGGPRIERLLERFRRGNPLLDEEAFQAALQECPNDECREFLAQLRESAAQGFSDEEVAKIKSELGFE